MQEFWETNVDGVFEGRTCRIVQVKWFMELEMREWGIKDIVISVPAQKITVRLYDEARDDFDDVDVYLDKVSVKGDTSTIPLSLQEVEIDKTSSVAYF